MLNKFMVVGKVQIIGRDNPDYPGFYVAPIGEESNLIPISLRKNQDLVQTAIFEQLKNGMTVGVNGKIDMTLSGIKLRVEKITIISNN